MRAASAVRSPGVHPARGPCGPSSSRSRGPGPRRRLPTFLATDDDQVPAEDLADAAQLLLFTKRHAEARLLYERAFMHEPGLLGASSGPGTHAYNAACAALREADGSPQAAELRAQALAWLLAALAQHERQLASTDPAPIRSVSTSLAWWRNDADLASVRDAAIDELPESQRKAWRGFGGTWMPCGARLPRGDVGPRDDRGRSISRGSRSQEAVDPQAYTTRRDTVATRPCSLHLVRTSGTLFAGHMGRAA